MTATQAYDTHQKSTCKRGWFIYDKLTGRLCRYVTRPAICLERLSTTINRRVSYELKPPFRDGTTHILFTPEDFLARLAALVPRPRANLTRYQGLCAQLAVPSSDRARRSQTGLQETKTGSTSNTGRIPRRSSATNLSSDLGSAPEKSLRLIAKQSAKQFATRTAEIDISVCPHCGGTLRVIADITSADVIHVILEHLKQRAPPAAGPRPAPSSRSEHDLFELS